MHMLPSIDNKIIGQQNIQMTHLSKPEVVKPYLKEGVNIAGVAQVSQPRRYPLQPDKLVPLLSITLLLLLLCL